MSTISLTPLERKLFDAPETWNMSSKEAARVLRIPVGSFTASRYRLSAKGVIAWEPDETGVERYAAVDGVAVGDNPGRRFKSFGRKSSSVHLSPVKDLCAPLDRLAAFGRKSSSVHLSPSEIILINRVDEWAPLSNDKAAALLDMPSGTFTACRSHLVRKGVLLAGLDGLYTVAPGGLVGMKFRLGSYSRRSVRSSNRHNKSLSGSDKVLVDKLCGILNASTFENAVEIVVGLCENGIISAEHVLRVKRRLHLMRQLRELESTIS